MDMIRIQTEDFDLGAEYQALRADAASAGAILSFVGLVRDFNEASQVAWLELEHYPGMAEASLAQLAAQARQRWPLTGVRIIHRVGKLCPADQIVFVGVSSAHRQDAFAACECIMDVLKTQAPFWKKETAAGKTRWLETKAADLARVARWQARD